MLTLPEKLIFALAVLVSLYFTFRAVQRIIAILKRGTGHIDWNTARRRIGSTLVKVITFQPVFRVRFGPSLLHGMVAWGFLYYLLVNFGDVLQAYIPDFIFLGEGWFGDLYRLGADLLSAAILTGMLALLLRRFVFRSPALTTRQDVLLHPKARFGIRRDSAIVGSFILLHVGGRFFGETFRLAAAGRDTWQPFASTISGLWSGWREGALTIAEHAAFWFALGLILAFLPYFLYSKHIHLFFAPLNFLLKPVRRSMGELSRLNFDDETIESFGVTRLEDLGWEQLMDAYACIMCYRCQEACPAYNTGKLLSPAALEINKRYFLNFEGARIARGEASAQTLIEFAIPKEAVWACTACGACIDICPVGNEPMRDILDIRRALVLNENAFPQQLQAAFRGMERNANPWNISAAERMKWADGLKVPTIEQNPEPELLWWVGCAPATDARAQKTAQAFAAILNAAGVNYAVLGKNEQCTGDSARRAGNEFIFNELASANVELLNEVAPKRIVTTCPHCLHALKNEYPAFGGNYTVIHHTQLINELLSAGKLKLNPANQATTITYHDPCYLGRHNSIYDPPREALKKIPGLALSEFPDSRVDSLCCGGGGGRIWMETPKGERFSDLRLEQAIDLGAEALVTACPYCITALEDSRLVMNHADDIVVKDITEILQELI